MFCCACRRGRLHKLQNWCQPTCGVSVLACAVATGAYLGLQPLLAWLCAQRKWIHRTSTWEVSSGGEFVLESWNRYVSYSRDLSHPETGRMNGAQITVGVWRVLLSSDPASLVGTQSVIELYSYFKKRSDANTHTRALQKFHGENDMKR